MTVEDLAKEILSKLDEAGDRLSLRDWIRLCEEVAHGATTRADAGEEDADTEEEDGDESGSIGPSIA